MKHRTDTGFTIVELLITIVVIAILAAISTIAYTNIQHRTHDSIVRADLAKFHKSLELTKVELGRYPYSTEFPPDLKLSRGSYGTGFNHVNYITNPEGSIYAFAVVSRSGQGFRLTHDGVIAEITHYNAASTASSIGLTWGRPNPSRQGHSTAGGWSSSWSLTN